MACQSQAGFDNAKEVASLADVVILYLGIDSTIEHEGADRMSIGLPAGQEQLLQLVVRAAAGQAADSNVIEGC